IVIVLINLFILATFARNRHLRKRSTYLVINLTMADLLLGVAAVLLTILEADILESHNILGEHLNWYAFLYLTLESLFPAASLANLSLISLERLHATIYPFRHCLIREQVYFTVITFSWLLALLFAFMMAILVVLRAQFTLFFYIFASHSILFRVSDKFFRRLNFSNETYRIVSEKEERAWFAAFVIEFIVIFLLNAFTLAIYTRNRHLRKHSTYLIINLTVADLLVGTVSGSSMSFELHNLETDLFSYAIIISTVKNNPPSPNTGPVLSTERKLTVTLFIVTVASFLAILPFVIWIVIAHHMRSKLCPAVFVRITNSFSALYLFNSIVNPLIYAVRMQEFRKAA
ncbi:unnamed protein product, partial [Porites lobata]